MMTKKQVRQFRERFERGETPRLSASLLRLLRMRQDHLINYARGDLQSRHSVHRLTQMGLLNNMYRLTDLGRRVIEGADAVRDAPRPVTVPVVRPPEPQGDEVFQVVFNPRRTRKPSALRCPVCGTPRPDNAGFPCGYSSFGGHQNTPCRNALWM